MNLLGDLTFFFSSKIEIKEIANLTAEFSQNTSFDNQDRLLKRRQEYLLKLTTLLKLSKSLSVELVPGDDNYLDKKNFTWSLSVYDETTVGLKFDFDFPAFISAGGKLDTMKITFFNTKVWISPIDERKLSIPDGYI